VKQQAIQYLAMDVHRATVASDASDGTTEAKAILTLVRSAGLR
jgi:hypothetical protein